MTAVQERHTAEGLSLADTITTPDYTIGALSVLDHTGDTRLMWDSRDDTEVSAARQMFATLRAEGRLIFRVKDGDSSTHGDQMTEFDPRAERMIAMHAPVGG